ncbi:hypothetical protein TYRP_016670 [Tyrophagus putrescentiae]|nr:hypothetical protein TYRP_016670 [Tyrophagus putrescentiae]
MASKTHRKSLNPSTSPLPASRYYKAVVAGFGIAPLGAQSRPKSLGSSCQSGGNNNNDNEGKNDTTQRQMV